MSGRDIIAVDIGLVLGQWSSCRSGRSQVDSAMLLATALYSDSALDRETVGWRFDDQVKRLFPRKLQKPDVDFRVTGHPTQSAPE